MSEEIQVDAPAAEEVKTDTVQEESKPAAEEAKPATEDAKPAAEESKPAAATEATPAQKEAIAALSEEDRESLAARASKQSMSARCLNIIQMLTDQSTSTFPTPTFPSIDTSSP